VGKNNLIMEEKNFTLSLNGKEVEALERLRESVGAETETDAVRYAISNFVDIENKHKMQEKEIERLKKNLGNLKELGIGLMDIMQIMNEF